MFHQFVPARVLVSVIAVLAALAVANTAQAQRGGYYAGIAYSQSTGKIGYTVRQARTEESAKQLAARNCGAPDAKTFIWGPNQWVAIATVDGIIGAAGFGRGYSSDEAQNKALAECGKRAKGHGYRVALCIHASGMRAQNLRSVARTAPVVPKTGFFAAIAFSPSTGKIGHTAGVAKTKVEAEKLALANCGEKDAKVFMWGEQWIAIAIAPDRKGTAGFGPGLTREAAEKAALEQCRKFSHGAPCRIALAIYSAGDEKQQVAKPVVPAPATGPAPASPAPAAPGPQLQAPAQPQ
jgi:hypothetical protein